MNRVLLCVAFLFFGGLTALAQPFYLPTANQALFEKGGEPMDPVMATADGVSLLDLLTE